MNRCNSKHRHFIAGPLCLVMLGMSMVLGYSAEERAWHAQARDPLSIEEESEVFMLDPWTVAELRSGSLDWKDGIGDLIFGEILLQGSQGVGLWVDQWTLTGFAGAYFTSYQGGHLTVAALSTPVIALSGDQVFVIPVGWQWSPGEDLHVIPNTFYRRQLQYLSSLPEISEVEVDLELVVEDHLTALLLAFHDDYRDLVRAKIDKSLWDETLIQAYLKTLPYADERGSSLSTEIVSRWIYDWQQYLEEREDVGDLVEELITDLEPLIKRAEHRGYPKRAEHLREALREISDGYGELIAPEALERLEEPVDYGERINPMIEDASSFAPEGASDDKEEVYFELMPPEILARTEQLLRESGAVYMMSTSISPLPPDSAHVREIVFSSSSGDRVLGFDLDLSHMEVSNIAIGDRIYPNTMGFDMFISWVKS